MSREIHLNLQEEIGNLLEKVAIEKVHMKKVSAKIHFVSNLFLIKKKDGGNRQFEESKSVHPPPPFQYGQPAIIEGYPQAGRLHVQI